MDVRLTVVTTESATLWYEEPCNPSDVSEDIYRKVVHPEDNISQANAYSGTEEMSEMLWNSKVHYRVYKTPQLICLHPD